MAVFGALAATDGANSMAILAAPQEPSGKMTWTSRDIAAADQTFTSPDPSLLNTWMVTAACVLAWKEAVFEPKTTKDDEKPSTQTTQRLTVSPRKELSQKESEMTTAQA